MPVSDQVLDNKSIDAPSTGETPVPQVPHEFGGPNALMDGYRAEADALQAAEDARPRDEHGRFLPATPQTVTTADETVAVDQPEVPPPPSISFEVATAARRAGLPQEWIDKAPSDDFVVLALQGLEARATASRSAPPPSQSPAPLVAKLELALNDAELAPELVEPLKKIIEHVNALSDQYGRQLNQVAGGYAALEAAYGQLRASTAQSTARQEAGTLDHWVAENPKLAAILGNASEALAQLDENGFPTTDKAFQWRKLAQKAGNVPLDTPQGRAHLTKVAKQLWPDAFQGVPERNGKGLLPPGASVRPAAKGDESRPQNAEEAELRRMEEAFAEVGARDARDWYVKTGGKPLPV